MGRTRNARAVSERFRERTRKALLRLPLSLLMAGRLTVRVKQSRKEDV